MPGGSPVPPKSPRIFNSLPIPLVYIFIVCKAAAAIQLESGSSHGSYTPLLQKTDIPNEIAKIFTLTDRGSANVCFLRNSYLDQEDVPRQCACTFSRLQRIELECANEQILNPKNCDKGLCETCCTLSLAPKFSAQIPKAGAPAICKMRCFNSPTVTDVTQDSLQALNDYLLRIDALYNEHHPRARADEKKEVPTQYEILPLKNKEDTL